MFYEVQTRHFYRKTFYFSLLKTMLEFFFFTKIGCLFQSLGLKVKEEKKEIEDEDAGNKELKRLQFYGAGPKMAGFDDKKEQKPRKSNKFFDFDPVS